MGAEGLRRRRFAFLFRCLFGWHCPHSGPSHSEFQIDFPAIRNDRYAELHMGFGEPGRLFGFFDQAKAGFSRGAPAFALVAGFAGSHDVLPAFPTPLNDGHDMVQGEQSAGELISAVLASVMITDEDIGSREPDQLPFFTQSDVVQEPENSRDLDGQRNRAYLEVRLLNDFYFSLKEELNGFLP